MLLLLAPSPYGPVQAGGTLIIFYLPFYLKGLLLSYTYIIILILLFYTYFKLLLRGSRRSLPLIYFKVLKKIFYYNLS